MADKEIISDEVLKQNLAELELQFQQDIINTLDLLEKKQLTKAEIAQAISEIDFFDEVNKLGLSDSLNKFMNSYHAEIERLINFADDEGVKTALRINHSFLQAVHDADYNYLLGSFSAQADKLKSALLKGVVSGQSVQQIGETLKDTGLTSAQLNTAVSTGLHEFRRMSTSIAYADKPEQKFLYGNGREIDNPTIRTTCKAALISQMGSHTEGVTRTEIDSSVYPDIDFIRGGGFNCSHSFYPANTRTIQWQLEESKKAYENYKSKELQ